MISDAIRSPPRMYWARLYSALRYARKLTLSPARVTEADAAAVYEVGWGDDALYSTVLVTALFNFYNRLVEGVGLALSDGYVPEAAKRLQLKDTMCSAKWRRRSVPGCARSPTRSSGGFRASSPRASTP